MTTYSGTHWFRQRPIVIGARFKCQRWLENSLLIETDACVLFPFTKDEDGYGRFRDTHGRKRRANNYVCERSRGPAPSPELVAAHECDNPSCINKRHLRWATRKENGEDMARRGRAAKSMAKVTPIEVREIRDRAPAQKHLSLAYEFGLAPSTVSAIINRTSWADVA